MIRVEAYVTFLVKRMGRVRAYLTVLVNSSVWSHSLTLKRMIRVEACVTLLVKRMERVRAYLTVLVNAIVATFVDPEAYDKGRSVTVLLNAICHVR